jgi:hypothetical protein
MRHQPKRRHEEIRQSDHSNRQGSFWGKLVHEPVSLFTAVLALFILVLTLVGGIQAWAFIASERAFVSVSSVDFSQVGNSPDQPFEIPVTAVNSGRSTARVTGFNITVIMNSLPSKPQYIPISYFSIKPLMVNSPEILLYRARPGPWPWKLSKAEIDKIESGEQKLFIFGFVKYRDDYSLWGDKETGFCFLYIPKPITPNWHLETCENSEYTYAH